MTLEDDCGGHRKRDAAGDKQIRIDKKQLESEKKRSAVIEEQQESLPLHFDEQKK